MQVCSLLVDFFVLSFWRIPEIHLQLLSKTFKKSLHPHPTQQIFRFAHRLEIPTGACMREFGKVYFASLLCCVAMDLSAPLFPTPQNYLHQQHEPIREGLLYTLYLVNIHFIFFPKIYIKKKFNAPLLRDSYNLLTLLSDFQLCSSEYLRQRVWSWGESGVGERYIGAWLRKEPMRNP